MADNMTTELEGGPGPEGQLNTKSEREPNSVVTFVYRGENPYMRFLARGLQARGVPVAVHEIPVEQYNVNLASIEQAEKDHRWDDRDELMKADREYKIKLLEPIASPGQGVVVTDRTIGGVRVFGERQLLGYDALDWYNNFTEQTVVEKLTPLIEQVRAQGKQPVLLQLDIGDHIPMDPYQGENLYAALIKKNFDIPVITTEHFAHRTGENISTILKGMKLDPEGTVLLVDHHLYNFKKEEVQETGMGEVQIVRICPCCVAAVGSRGEGSDEKLQKLGFKLFPVQVDPSSEAVNILMRMIDGKRAELTSGYRELHESLVGLGEIEPNLIYQTTKDDKPEVIIIPNYDKEEVREKNWPDNSVTVAVGDDKIRILSVSPRSHRDEQNSEVRINEPMTHYFRPQEDGSVMTEKEIASDLWRPEPGPGGGMVSGRLRDTEEKDPEVKYQALLESLYKRNEANMQKLGQSLTPEQTERYAALKAAFDPETYTPGENLAARFNALAQKLSA